MASKCEKLNVNEVRVHISFSPDGAVGELFQTVGVADEFVKSVDDLPKFGPFASGLLPAVQHQLVEDHRAVHRSGQPVTLIYSFNHLKQTHASKK